MFATLATAQELADSHKWWKGGQALTVAKVLTSPEDACSAGMQAVKHAGGAADSDMPEDFCACPRIYEGDQSCACPYQYNHANY